jgi:hypothetical protein
MFKQIGDWLTQMGLTFAYNEEKRAFVLPYEIDDNKFLVTIIVFPDTWIKVLALIVENDKIPKDMHLALLQENWNLFEVTYSMDQYGNLFSENDLPQTTNYDNFVSEFQAVIYGVKHFFDEVAPKFRLKAAGTYDRNYSAWV